MSSETVLIITDVHKTEILLQPSLVHHLYLVCLQAACNSPGQSPVLFLFLWGQSSWLQQASLLARAWEKLWPVICQPSMTFPKRKKQRIYQERTQQFSKTFCPCKAGVLIIMTFISVLGPSYTIYTSSLVKNSKRTIQA